MSKQRHLLIRIYAKSECYRCKRYREYAQDGCVEDFCAAPHSVDKYNFCRFIPRNKHWQYVGIMPTKEKITTKNIKQKMYNALHNDLPF